MEHPKPVIQKESKLSGVWLLPVIALVLATWLLYKGYRDSGIPIKVFFPDAHGIIANKTKVKFRGMEVGRVSKLSLLNDGSGVYVHVEMAKETAPYLTDALKFWLVKPRAGVGGISGLETLVSGAYIQVDAPFQPTGKEARLFDGLLSPPATEIPEVFVTHRLVSDAAKSISPGVGVYYRKLLVGEVHDVRLDEDLQGVEIIFALEPQYKDLVKEDSRFWNVSGVRANMGMDGILVETDSVTSMVLGGIAFNSPKSSAVANENSVFPLYESLEMARTAIEVDLTIPATEQVRVGTKIFFHEYEAGKITQLNWSKNFKTLVGKARLNQQVEPLLRKGTKFWIQKAAVDLSSIDLSKLIQGTTIQIKPGQGEYTNRFQVATMPPEIQFEGPDLDLFLITKERQGLNVGTPIVYRGQTIGKVESIRFETKARQFKIHVVVEESYQELISDASIFYNMSSVKLKVDFDGIAASIPQPKQILTGAIGLYSNSNGEQKTGKPVKDGHTYSLFEDYDAATSVYPETSFQIHLNSASFASPTVGAPLLYHQFQVGKVKKVSLKKDASGTEIQVIVFPEYQQLLKTSSTFWLASGVDVEASLKGLKISTGSIKSVLVGGIAFETPSHGKFLKKPKTSFTLFESKDKAMAKVPQFQLTLKRNSSLSNGASVQYRGQKIGEVIDSTWTPDFQSRILSVWVEPSYLKKVARSNTQFILMRPEISLRGVQNPGALITGDFLSVEVGKGAEKFFFDVIDDPRDIRPEANAFWITLVADDLGSLKVGSPLLYRKIRIGEVKSYYLAPTANHVEIIVNVELRYRSLVKDTSKFWNASGLRVEASLFNGLKIDSESVETIVGGGIAIATPEEGNVVQAGHEYSLYKIKSDSWDNWRPHLKEKHALSTE
ncbi:PqiB family protein [Algicola sagamiensis]|uniref:PqiB family protein n=1 Tax=Algicola sagamiensis TaxID=163869 RepID=UPI0003606831|nr:MlaD family protein [Algicola sagamiensis]